MTAEPFVPESAEPQPAHSVFEPECPKCGVAMRPEAGWIWSCPGCAFRAERVAGTLLEIGPEPGRSSPANGAPGAVTGPDLRSLR